MATEPNRSVEAVALPEAVAVGEEAGAALAKSARHTPIEIGNRRRSFMAAAWSP
jgi:hypothetical protein